MEEANTTSLSSTSSIAMPIPVRPSSRSAKHQPVPLILEAFPTPPSFIPPSPAPGTPTASSVLRSTTPGSARAPTSRATTPNSKAPPSSAPPYSLAFNPPPSLPPAAPLPPVPGPSPISDHESILIMSQSTRSRRSSKLSIQSSSTRTSMSCASPRTSTDTGITSGGSFVSPPVSGNTAGAIGRRGSVASSIRSARSYSSNGSSNSHAFPRAPFADKSSTVGYTISEEDSADLSHAEREPRTLSDKENIGSTSMKRESPTLYREPRRAGTEDSIASIDMRDLPPPDIDDQTPLNPEQFHMRVRATRSKSESHKRILRSQSSSPGARTSGQTSAPVPPLPIRATSPDIADIISTTPRPRPRTQSQYSNGSASRSGSTSRPSSMKRYGSEIGNGRRPSSSFSRTVSDGARVTSPVELAYLEQEDGWNDDSYVEDYGTPLDKHDHFSAGVVVDINPALESQFDREGSDSDSSIDLHTPLPHLMLRHGLLSPHSKLLPESSRASTPHELTRPESTMSIASNVSVKTKSGLFKDQRDTPQRRVRHRDGKQLRAGMGLTTGLGWSDSEDEDAPSPLTRRLSTLNLSNRKSTSSLKSSTLSRSQSNSTLHEEEEEVPAVPRRPMARSRPSIPPTSWNSNGGGGGGRTSTGSVGSQFSLTLSIPEEEILERDRDSKSSSRRPSDGSGYTSRSKRDAALDTPSTSSTASLPMPLTPDDAPTQLKVEKEKVLPPLPSGGLRKYQSSLALRTPSSYAAPGLDVEPRERTFSNASSVSSSGAVSGHFPSPTVDSSPSLLATPSTSYTPRTATTPRPLRLSQSQTLLPQTQPGELVQRPGQVLAYNRNIHDQQRLRAASGPARPVPARGMSVPNTPTTPSSAKPMPRTGTGMVYRTSSNPGRATPSRMRLPSANSLSGVSPPTRTSSVPRPIAL